MKIDVIKYAKGREEIRYTRFAWLRYPDTHKDPTELRRVLAHKLMRDIHQEAGVEQLKVAVLRLSREIAGIRVEPTVGLIEAYRATMEALAAIDSSVELDCREAKRPHIITLEVQE
jgi:hypothetical protein